MSSAGLFDSSLRVSQVTLVNLVASRPLSFNVQLGRTWGNSGTLYAVEDALTILQ